MMSRRPPAEPETGPKSKKSSRLEPLPLSTSRPEFAKNRATIRLIQGDPDGALEKSGKRLRSYIVLSDLSEESGYAVEWAIGERTRNCGGPSANAIPQELWLVMEMNSS